MTGHQYRVVMKDGTVHKAIDVDHKPGFVALTSWDGERRVPAGEVVEIYTSKTERKINITFFSMLLLVIVLIAIIFLVETNDSSVIYSIHAQ